jgi:UDP-N-acetylmuramate dehydrogenase
MRRAGHQGVDRGEMAVIFPDILGDIRRRAPELRGRLIANQPLADLTWFRVGGPAQALFVPLDEADLGYFLSHIDGKLPVTAIGLGSNLIVRDGGCQGIAIRLGRKFNDIVVEPGGRVRIGAAVPDVKVAQAAQAAGLAGLAFLRGIPGAIGGALRMNGGAYGREIKDVLIEARGVDRQGRLRVFPNAGMGFGYRHCEVPEDIIFTQALLQASPGDPDSIAAEMQAITTARETTQPIKSRTGGSTFKNPPGAKAWQLIDAAGCRGLKLGGAQVSELHCNFLINLGVASAADIEGLGELVRKRVKQSSGVDLEWEIRRIGHAVS